MDRERKREIVEEGETASAQSRLAQAPVPENGALCTVAAWPRLTGEATCASQTGWQVYRRACTPSRLPTWLSPVGLLLCILFSPAPLNHAWIMAICFHQRASDPGLVR